MYQSRFNPAETAFDNILFAKNTFKVETSMVHPIKNPYSIFIDINTVIFDFDGTLANTQKATMMTFVQVLGKLGMAVEEQSLCEEMTALSVAEMFRSVGLSKDLVPTACECYKALYQILSPQWASLFPGVKQILETLDAWGLSLAIATNESRDNLDNLLSAFGIANLFKTSCCADEVTRSKPFPDMGIKILEHMNAHPSRTLMVGDSVFDMAMGNTLGLHTCAVGYGAFPITQLLAKNPDYAIQNFNELLTLLIQPPLIHTDIHGILNVTP